MIDIIIPVYIAKETIKRTLDSISMQKDINYKVTLVNDCDNEDYSEIIKNYKNTKMIYNKKNTGPGGARQFGLDNTRNKYIIFIDSDDYLYDEYSLSKLYNKIKENNLDWVISNFEYHRDNIIEIKKNDLIWLHGKIYNREFLNKYSIRFNNTRANEDNGFNRLYLLCEPKLEYLDLLTYVYEENPNSITRKDDRLYKYTSLEYYSYNMEWAIEEAAKRKENKILYNITAWGAFIAMYFYYLELKDKYDGNKILKWSKNLLDLTQKYDNEMSEGFKITMLEEKKKQQPNIKIDIDLNDFIDLIKRKDRL